MSSTAGPKSNNRAAMNFVAFFVCLVAAIVLLAGKNSLGATLFFVASGILLIKGLMAVSKT